MQKSYFFLFVLLVFGGALSHPVEAVGQEGRRLKIVSPEMDSLAINDSVAFFRGMADPSGQLFLNGEEVKIYGTCVFAIEYTRLSPGGDLSLQPGDLLQVEMKATPGMQATFYKGIPFRSGLDRNRRKWGLSRRIYLAAIRYACRRNATLFSPRPEDQEGGSGRKPAAADSA